MSLNMVLSQKGLDLIKSFEGIRLTAYWDSLGSVWTIGYGHTGGVYDGQVITQAQAEELLRQDTGSAQSTVNNNVTVTLTQGQFDALVSFTFNCGSGAFTSSTLLVLLNQGNYSGACAELDKWVHAGGVVVQGLVNRRNAEQDLFNSTGEGTYTPPSYDYGFSDNKQVQKFLNASGIRDNNGNSLIVDGKIGLCSQQAINKAKDLISKILG